MATRYTLAPSPYQTALDATGTPISGALIYTYLASTTTPVDTYADADGTLNDNPIEADSAGRFVVYLDPTKSYKFDYCLPVSPIPPPNNPPSHYLEVDDIDGVPNSASSGQDVTATFGENVNAGQAVYWSDGSGGKTAGRVYKTDSGTAYSSTAPAIGIAQETVTSGNTGTVRVSGRVTGLSGLVAGATYYLGTAGALTATPPSFPRIIGQADSTTSLILPDSTLLAGVDNTICDGRLTLTTAVPVTTADVTAATTIYFTPYKGNRIALYDGTAWFLRSFAEISIAVPATTSQMYDIWVYDSSGTLTLELLAWSGDTTRATALVAQNGVLVKTGVTSRRYLGSFRTTGSSGQTEDSVLKRYLWNYYNRVPRVLQRLETNNTWDYSMATIRQAGGSTANQVDLVIGVLEVPVQVTLNVQVANNSGGNVQIAVGIGEDSTTTFTVGQSTLHAGNFTPLSALTASLVKYPAAVGRHFYSWNEWSAASATTSFWARNVGTTALAGTLTGLTGSIQG